MHVDIDAGDQRSRSNDVDGRLFRLRIEIRPRGIPLTGRIAARMRRPAASCFHAPPLRRSFGQMAVTSGVYLVRANGDSLSAPVA